MNIMKLVYENFGNGSVQYLYEILWIYEIVDVVIFIVVLY